MPSEGSGEWGGGGGGGCTCVTLILSDTHVCLQCLKVHVRNIHIRTYLQLIVA